MKIKYELETQPFCCETKLAIDSLNTLNYINKKKKGKFASVAIFGDEEIIERLLKIFCKFEFEDETEVSFKNLDYDYVDYDGLYAFIITLEDCYCKELTISIEKAEYEDTGECKFFEQDWLYIDELYEDLIKKHIQVDTNMDIFCITDECDDEFDDEDFDCLDCFDDGCEDCDMCQNNFEDDESIDLYGIVEHMVNTILKDKFSE